MKRHLIKDFDGVIADTGEMNFGIIRELFPHVTPQEFADHHNGNVYEEPLIPFTDENEREYTKLYDARLALEHLSMAMPFMHWLGEHFTQHIVSSNCEAAIDRVLREAEARHLYAEILGKEADRSKVVKLQRILDAYQISPEDTVFVTDTLGDLNEAAKLDIPTIAVTFGYHSREVLLRGNPSMLADSWVEVLSHLEVPAATAATR